jgi:hypothetical protein
MLGVALDSFVPALISELVIPDSLVFVVQTLSEDISRLEIQVTV